MPGRWLIWATVLSPVEGAVEVSYHEQCPPGDEPDAFGLRHGRVHREPGRARGAKVGRRSAPQFPREMGQAAPKTRRNRRARSMPGGVITNRGKNGRNRAE